MKVHHPASTPSSTPASNPQFLLHPSSAAPATAMRTESLSLSVSLCSFARRFCTRSSSSSSSSSTSWTSSILPPFPPRTPLLELQPLLPAARAYHALKQPPLVTFLLGGPGSGKGTLSDLIVSRLSYTHLSIGALLRAAATARSPNGATIAAIIARGNVVPQSISTPILLAHLAKLQGHVVVDGFPRTLSHAILWESLGLTPYRVLALEVEEDVMRRRLQGRKREDDIPGVIDQRLRQYRNEWELIKGFYKERGLLVQIDGNGSPEVTYDNFEAAHQSHR